VIVDADACARAGWPLVAAAEACLNGGARFVQVRAKNFGSGELLNAVRAIVAMARRAGATTIVNDRPDVARMAEADGVHLGQTDLPPSAARGIVGAAAIVGRSTHTPAQIDAAVREPIDYVAIGPVFATSTKATGYEAVGLTMVERAARSGRPVVAIGGITIETAASVIGAGASSVAVISDLFATGDPEGRVREYIARLERI
jgi:thiamine-phosphate pyrophosphorylase